MSLQKIVANQSVTPEPQFYTVKQAAAILGCETQTIRNKISQDQLPFETKKIFGKRLIVVSSLKKYLEDGEGSDQPLSVSDEGVRQKRGRGRPRNVAKENTTLNNNV